RRHTRCLSDWSSDVCSSDLGFTADELLRAIETGSTQHRAYMAMDGDAAVSIGRLYTHPQSQFGGLYGGGTRATHRSRGLYRAVEIGRASWRARGDSAGVAV